MKKKHISNNVIRRLPKYLHIFDKLMANGIFRTSSYQISDLLGLTASQVRQDFNCFGAFGQQGYGYDVAALRAQIADILGMNRGYTAVLVGAGNIGHALIEDFNFSEWGVTLTRAFDGDPHISGKDICGIHVSPIEELPNYLRTNRPEIAVLALPKEAAKPSAELLIENGVKAIWNFTNEDLVEPENPVIVENIHFSDSLLALSYFVTAAMDSKKKK